MKKFLIPLLATPIFIFSFLPQQEPEKCGINRWDVKTFADVNAKRVNMKPILATIDSLRQIKPTQKYSDNSPRAGAEFYTFQITCGIREYIKEDDGDIHLILYDLKDTVKTFVAELPDPNCPSVKGTKYAPKYQKCRDEFEKYKLPKGRVAKGQYTLSGIFFIDKAHGVKNAPPNSAELHPLLTLKKIK
jgi:hypothetical protein